MTFDSVLSQFSNWHEQAYQYLLKGEYSKAASLYEQAIEIEPDVKLHYWYLGLMVLLQGQEAEAQTTWLLGMLEGDPEELEQWTQELIEVLKKEADRQKALGEYSPAWLILGHIREIQPTNLNNLLDLIQLAIQLEKFSPEEMIEWSIIELLHNQQPGSIDAERLMPILKKVLELAPLQRSSLEFAALCMPHVHPHPDFFRVILHAVADIGYSLGNLSMASSLMELCLRIDDSNPEILRHLAAFYQDSGYYSLGIEIARWCYSIVEKLPHKIFANHLLLRGLMCAGGYWDEACELLKRHELLISNLVKEPPTEIDQPTVARLITSSFFLPYFQDVPQQTRLMQNQLMGLCQSYLQSYDPEAVKRYKQRHLNRKKTGLGAESAPLKIGYVSHCLKSHSVGWLARWLFQHHDRDRFEIYIYFVSYRYTGEPLQDWYESQVFKAHKFGGDNIEIAEQISQDEIDILVDLDSITLDVSSEVMALKPAPVQVTWLGWDASGLPAIDYFLADPYVLPEEAQDYYSEKIWRLPDTYIAVDGFEVGVPTLRRDQLEIPNNAVVYFSGQRGFKRHLNTARLQMKIIKNVPNSFFLIKGFADKESIKSFFTKLAEEEGVDPNRLRFLPPAATESTHRANLGIADVVLDTFPYNGATTTLETLWMGIPLVTRVGQQFAARNSYTMMMNVGVTEGIAWSDDEYVEWGIRIGEDSALRKEISWRLLRSRHNAPLWNGKKFAREIENAYQQMWLKYLETTP
ncbi:O-linked N-acetylglucosamine transferase, SPINDLY family protein [Oscillatoria sp. HE19RPO]|uniref:O-linked N-acetylglucosamine transferase, SPINDLY family protein n=1 Tax=Oscillatoria sp. HE19RPO TaxID=2954806 RepID=UPI0020C4CE6E|nr:O-linked N-acetylglucosamine transferase, SPINDLY family protein [Oscillatoria sp. HE19RPO]